MRWIQFCDISCLVQSWWCLSGLFPAFSAFSVPKTSVRRIRGRLRDLGLQEGELRSRDVLLIAIPMILSNATVPLVGIADAAVVGQLNDPALIGGVSPGSTIFAMLFLAFGFLRMGTIGLTAQAVGAGDPAEAAANLYRALLIAVIAGQSFFSLYAPPPKFLFHIVAVVAPL